MLTTHLCRFAVHSELPRVFLGSMGLQLPLLRPTPQPHEAHFTTSQPTCCIAGTPEPRLATLLRHPLVIITALFGGGQEFPGIASTTPSGLALAA